MNKVNSSYFKKGHKVNKGRVFSKERNAKISAARKGIKFTEEHKKNLSNSLKGRKSPRKGCKMSKESKLKLSLSNKGKPSPRKGVILSNEIKQKISKNRTGKAIGHKSNFPKGYKHSDDVKEKISRAARLNWTKDEFRKKCLGRNQFKKSYMENKLFKQVKRIYPNVQDDFVINGNGWSRFPDCFVPELDLVIEYDGKRWHKLEDDKKRDKEILGLGYKILHYQGYIPSVNEIISDIRDLKESYYKYKRDFIDITIKIEKIKEYEELLINNRKGGN